MYCDKCGTPFAAGAQYCVSCGKPIAGATAAPCARNAGAQAAPAGPAGPAASYATRAATAMGDGRVARNVTLLGVLWATNGVLRLMGLGWLVMFHRFFDWGWPFGAWGPFRSLFWGGLLSGGFFLAAFGLIHLLLAWGLFERQPWARVLGVVLGILALIRFPFGTALGIYTLWVLLPEGSAREYDAMAGMHAPVSVAR